MSAPLQHLRGELPDHLQRPVAVGVVDRGHEQAVLDERVEGVEYVRARQQVARGALEGFQDGATREGSQHLQECPRCFVQQVVAPLQGVPQGSLALRHVPRSAA
jgi:hypothetical protein